jgi:hypothetical protein
MDITAKRFAEAFQSGTRAGTGLRLPNNRRRASRTALG